MECALRGETFHRGDRAALVLHREREAGDDACTVHKHSAGAAGTLIAALLGARQVEMIPKKVKHGGA